jgi:3-oxoacyl-[acyl-carrier protein] reductase
MESTLTLKGKVALVTGSTRGIGWACAKLFAQCGATVILNGVSQAGALKSKVEELRSVGGGIVDGLLFDVSNHEEVKKAYNHIFQEFKRLDVLVNNAGILEDGLIGMISQDAIERTMKTNVYGVILNVQYASRLMMRNRGGSIINMTSIIGRVGNAGQVVYGGSKSAVIGITLSAAKELAQQNIRVNAIAPGFIETDMVKKLPEEKYQERLKSIKMNRIGTPEDVAHAALFFASDLSSYVTGQILGVDGGMLI